MFSHYLNNELLIASPDEKLDGCALEISLLGPPTGHSKTELSQEVMPHAGSH